MLFLRENTQKPITRPRAGDEWLHIMQVHCQEGSSSLSCCPWTVICALRDDKYSNRCGLPETKQADLILKSWRSGRKGVRGRRGNNSCHLLISVKAPLGCSVSCEWPSRKAALTAQLKGCQWATHVPPPLLGTWWWWLLFLQSRPCSHLVSIQGTERQAPSPRPWGLGCHRVKGTAASGEWVCQDRDGQQTLLLSP